ncbi:DUF7547 family protein [Halopiger djelfimassiliensis]|uniref:DUF7547 family protein n=1 Tax=Halopiger djelfimassiliensis TaxID=1293047 RepID=UPI000678147D|nr:hypothetical protein [Halopiger djelfimassiliensis]
MADRDDDELVDAVRELTRTIDELREELDTTSPRRRPPLRPPTPRELLAFTDDVAIPATLAVLESSVRTLEAFQRGLEIVRTEREVRDRASEMTATTSDRAGDLRRTTLSQLDSVLAELQRAVSSGTLSADEDARDLLTEARELRDEVDERLRNATSSAESERTDSSTAVEIDIDDHRPQTDGTDDGRTDGADGPDPGVDVDAELETLRDQYAPDDDDPTKADSNRSDRPEADSGSETDNETDRSDESDEGEDSDGDNGTQTGSNR